MGGAPDPLHGFQAARTPGQQRIFAHSEHPARDLEQRLDDAQAVSPQRLGPDQSNPNRPSVVLTCCSVGCWFAPPRLTTRELQYPPVRHAVEKLYNSMVGRFS